MNDAIRLLKICIARSSGVCILEWGLQSIGRVGLGVMTRQDVLVAGRAQHCCIS